jgi:hypothetical protein
MRLKYSTTDPAQDEFDSLPRIPLVLRYNLRQVEVFGLLDSGATVNVLPYEIGVQLGAIWDESQANLRLAGNLGRQTAMPLFLMTSVGEFSPVRLAFAWSKSNNVPIVLGQMNFFMEFDVCFYRSRSEFEVNPKS